MEILSWCSRSRRSWCGSGGAFRADQFLHRGNFRAHYLNTGPEILRQSGRSIQAFCGLRGEAGARSPAVRRRSRKYDPEIQCYVVEPEGAAVIAGEEADCPGHRIQGGGYSMADLDCIDREHVDGYLQVSDDEAIRMARRLAREEGLFAGFSSGANPGRRAATPGRTLRREDGGHHDL